MTSSFRNNLASGLKSITQAAGEIVEYTRDGQTIAVTAVVADMSVEMITDSNFPVVSGVKTFRVAVDRLGFEPVEGDGIVWDGQDFEVMRIDGKRVFERLPGHYRIYAKDV